MRNRVLLAVVFLLPLLSNRAYGQTSDKEFDPQQWLDEIEAENFTSFSATRAIVSVSENGNYDRDYSATLTKTLIAKFKRADVAVLDQYPENSLTNLVSFLIYIKDSEPKNYKYVHLECHVGRSVRLLESMATVIRAPLWTRQNWKVTDNPREFIHATFDQVLTRLMMNIYAAKARRE